MPSHGSGFATAIKTMQNLFKNEKSTWQSNLNMLYLIYKLIQINKQTRKEICLWIKKKEKKRKGENIMNDMYELYTEELINECLILLD